MIKRQAAEILRHLASQFKAVAVVGSRQSGKTTLVQVINHRLAKRFSAKISERILFLMCRKRFAGVSCGLFLCFEEFA